MCLGVLFGVVFSIVCMLFCCVISLGRILKWLSLFFRFDVYRLSWCVLVFLSVLIVCFYVKLMVVLVMLIYSIVVDV